MATFADSLTDDEIRGLVQKHGREKVIKFLDMDENAPDEEIKAVFGVPQADPNAGVPLFTRAVEGAEKVATNPATAATAAGLGLAAPIAGAATTGAPMLPVIGGLAAGMGAGALADLAMGVRVPFTEGTTKEHLLRGASGLREMAERRSPSPQSPSVGWNFAQNLAREVTMPELGLANLFEAAPTLAASYAGGKGALAAARGMTPSRVSPEQAPGALLDQLSKQYGTPPAPMAKPGLFAPMTSGELAASLKAGSEPLGVAVRQAKKEAYAAAKVPEALGETVRGAIRAGMSSRGVPRQGADFVPALSKSPEAAKKLLAISEKTAPRVRTMEEARSLQARITEEAKKARRGPERSSEKAAVFEGAAGTIDRVLKSMIPQPQRGALEAANKPFSGYARIEEMALKSTDARGNFSPQRFVKQWNSMTPEQKSRYFEPEQIKAWNALTKQEPGVLRRGWEALKGLRNTVSGAAVEPAPVLFNVPPAQRLAPVSNAIQLGVGAATQPQSRLFRAVGEED